MSHTILVVEDHPELQLLVEMTLDTLGAVTCVPDAATALDAIAQERPSLVVLDVWLGPGLSGLDVSSRLKSDPATSGIKILLLSACGQQSDIDAGLATGAEAYIVKPFSPEHLYQAVSSLLS